MTLSGCVHGDAVSAADFRLIEFGVDSFEESLGLLAASQTGDAEGSRDRTNALTARAQHPLLGLELVADAVGDMGGVVELGVRENDRKFLAAVARRGVSPLDVARKQFAEKLQHHVADRVAEPVIDLLEMVEIGHDQTHVGIIVLRLLYLLEEIGVEEAAVAERGQRVAHAKFVGLGEIGAQFGDLLARLLQAPGEVVHLVLDLLILVDQQGDDGADLLGFVERRQVAIGAFKRFGIARIVLEMRLDELDDDRKGVVELQRHRIAFAQRTFPYELGLGRALEAFFDLAETNPKNAKRDQRQNISLEHRRFRRLRRAQSADDRNRENGGDLQTSFEDWSHSGSVADTRKRYSGNHEGPIDPQRDIDRFIGIEASRPKPHAPDAKHRAVYQAFVTPPLRWHDH